MELNLDLRTLVVSEGLSKDAVQDKIDGGGLSQLFIHDSVSLMSSSEKSNVTRRSSSMKAINAKMSYTSPHHTPFKYPSTIGIIL